MNDKIELLQLTANPSEDCMASVDSERIRGYSYIITQEAYQELKSFYGDDQESDEAFAEDITGWLTQIFDCNNFTEFEQEVISYFGGEQKAVTFLASKNRNSAELFTETGKQHIEIKSVAEDNDHTEEFLDDLFNTFETELTIQEKPSETNPTEVNSEEEEPSVAEVLQFLSNIEKNNLRELFLSLFAKNVSGLNATLTGIMYDSLLKGLMIGNESVPEATEDLLAKIMTIFVNKWGE